MEAAYRVVLNVKFMYFGSSLSPKRINSLCVFGEMVVTLSHGITANVCCRVTEHTKRLRAKSDGRPPYKKERLVTLKNKNE
jgi:hypothetical protein